VEPCCGMLLTNSHWKADPAVASCGIATVYPLAVPQAYRQKLGKPNISTQYVTSCCCDNSACMRS
jgi:hypothetical protein